MQKLLEIMRRLRDPLTGCPWDLEQDFASIAPHTIEEAYEVADAIQRQQPDELKAELGDLLFQVVFHAQMAQEEGHFNFADVENSICEKMLRRHPHVFGDDTVSGAAQQTRNWAAQKAEERRIRGMQSRMDDIPAGMAELQRAVKLQNRAAEVDFDWGTATPILDKIEEEVDELRAELAAAEPHRLEDELGDLLFACTNLARKLELDPARALRHANYKFEQRFRSMEQHAASRGQSLEELDLEEMEVLWQEIKLLEHSAGR